MSTMPVESRVSSEDKRAGADSVDAVRNPTTLFRRINDGKWDEALDAVHNNPSESSIWISRRNSKGDGLAWKYLPLHLICLQQRPSIELLLTLLKYFPEGASLTTPQDGNLPIHYLCESGCQDERVFGALLAAFPQSLEVKNAKDKSPLLMCHARSRGILMKVLRQRKPLPFSDGQQQKNGRDRDRKSRRRKGAERRNDIDATRKEEPSREPRQSHPRHRRPPQTTPARCAKYHRTTFAETSGPGAQEFDIKTPKAPKNCPSKRQAKKDHSFVFYSSSGDGEQDNDAAAYISSKTTELARSALNYLYPSRQDQVDLKNQRGRDQLNEQVRSLTKENAAKQRIIDDLTKKLERLTHSAESSTENPKLCERILAKAEADNVAFRTQIQKLEDEKEELKRAADLKEKANRKCLDRARRMLSEKGSEMKIDVFGSGSSSGSSGRSSEDKDQIPEALRTVLSHMDDRNTNLYSTIGRLEQDLSKLDVNSKLLQSKNQLLQDEKDFLTKSYRELERKATILEEEKGLMQTGVGDLKDRVSTLTVINQSLQESVDSMSNSQVTKENEHFRSEVNRLNAQLVQMKEEKESTAQIQHDPQRVVEIEEKLEILSEKNRSLKDTLLKNNEKYSKKVQELGEKYSLVEKANEELRQNLAGGVQPETRMPLEGDSKLLYEV